MIIIYHVYSPFGPVLTVAPLGWASMTLDQGTRAKFSGSPFTREQSNPATWRKENGSRTRRDQCETRTKMADRRRRRRRHSATSDSENSEDETPQSIESSPRRPRDSECVSGKFPK